jgi:hypothetical protein
MLKVPATVDQDLRIALDTIAFRPDVMNVTVEAVVGSQDRFEPDQYQSKPPPDKDPTWSPRWLRRITIIQR